MKGLFLKDFYTMKTNLIVSFCVCMQLIITLLLGSAHSEGPDINMVIYIMCWLIPSICTQCSMFILDGNPNSKINMFFHSLPINKRIFIAEKYIITYALFSISYLLIFISTILNMIINNYSPDVTVFYTCFLIFSGLLLFINIEFPLIMKFGQMIASCLIILFIGITIIAALYFAVKFQTSISVKNSLLVIYKNKLLFTAICIIIDIVGCTLSFRLSQFCNYS